MSLRVGRPAWLPIILQAPYCGLGFFSATPSRSVVSFVIMCLILSNMFSDFSVSTICSCIIPGLETFHCHRCFALIDYLLIGVVRRSIVRNMWVFPKIGLPANPWNFNRVFGFSIINHPFWGPYFWKHPCQ